MRGVRCRLGRGPVIGLRLALALALALGVACARPVSAPLAPPAAPAPEAAVEPPNALEQRFESGLVPPDPAAGDESPGVPLAQLMAELNVPGLSIAVCEHEQVVWARGYGLAQREPERPVTPSTLFQAGSISKSVNALAVLLSAERGAFSLDAPINGLLRSWALPDNELTRRSPVTLRRLLSHTAGTTVHGFPGYPTGAPLPTLPQVLDGAAPANTPPVRVELLPGSAFRYSGGGISITQLVLTDHYGRSYPALLDELVLAPLGMASSTYEEPLPPERLALAAVGYGPEGTVIPSERHVYPEMAAAGLWTTPSDLATFFCELGRARAGRSTKVSQAVAREMTTEVDPKAHAALGVFLSERNGAAFFGHGGVDEGFQASALASQGGGFALVMMANSANGVRLFPAVERTVFAVLGWPGAQ
jgi:CubicO group peptidase (beta-lactamase class C family)